MELLKILTLNTWNREGPYQVREPLIKSWIKRLEPDLIGFQEVGPEQAGQLLDGIGYHYEWAGHGESGIAVATRWEIKERSHVDLPGVEPGSVGGILLGCHKMPPSEQFPLLLL